MIFHCNGENILETQAAAEMLKAFSHPTRLAILLELQAGHKCMTDMEEPLSARQANISRHLGVLRHARFVGYAQDGTLRCYYLTRPLLVKDMLTLVGRDALNTKRTPEELQAQKVRLEKLHKWENQVKSKVNSHQQASQ